MLPAFGMANEIIPVFSRKVIFGYPAMVLATVAIGFISLSVWSHHMFTVGLGPGPNAFFTLSTMIIAIPTGIKIFNWLATMWGGRIRFASPMLFSLGFLFNFPRRRAYGHYPLGVALRLAAWQQLLCGRPLSFCSGGRDPDDDFPLRSTTGSRR